MTAQSTHAAAGAGRPAVPCCRRSGRERRRYGLRWLVQGGLSPRRRMPRRAADHQRYVADWYAPDLLYVAIAILVCSAADAILTLTLLELGAREVNLFMVGLVHGDPQSFAGWKMVLTGVGVIHLVIRHRVRVFGRIPVRQVLHLILAAYAGLVAYELWLLACVVPAP